MSSPVPDTVPARSTRRAATAKRAKRKIRTLTAAQEVLFFCITGAVALSLEAALVLHAAAIVE